jgi:hypothetical protein
MFLYDNYKDTKVEGETQVCQPQAITELGTRHLLLQDKMHSADFY